MLGLLAVPAFAQTSQQLTAQNPAALPNLDQRIGLGAHRGEAAWSGPLLWDTPVAAAAVDPTRPAGQVRLVVRVSGGP